MIYLYAAVSAVAIAGWGYLAWRVLTKPPTKLPTAEQIRQAKVPDRCLFTEADREWLRDNKIEV